MGKTQQFGDLELAFTDHFALRWNDRHSGGFRNGAFWHPIPPQGFHPVGGLGLGNHGDPNNNVAALCVAASEAGNDALAEPRSYECIWTDRGSSASRHGSCWRPIPPDGYVALGDVFVSAYNEPSNDDVVCVSEGRDCQWSSRVLNLE